MAASSQAPKRSRRRAIVAASVGNALEWFDWTVYATFAIFFSTQFFPPANETTALLATYGIFAVGFIMRPLGGWIIGSFADRRGRKAALVLSILMMAGGSLVIGLSPTFAAVGIVAPIILTLARLVQGLSLGGLYASATTLLAEIAPARRRGFYSSFVFFSLAAGILVASALGWGLTTNLTVEAMQSWGWRVPFILGGVGGLIGLWIRSAVPEPEASPVASGKDVVKRPLQVLLREHPVALLRIVGFATLTTFAFYIFVPYLPTYAIRAVGAEASVAFAANTVGLIVFMLLQPLFGALSDRIGRKPQLIFFALGYLVLFYPADVGDPADLRLDSHARAVRPGALRDVLLHRARDHVGTVPRQRARRRHRHPLQPDGRSAGGSHAVPPDLAAEHRERAVVLPRSAGRRGRLARDLRANAREGR